MDWKWLAAWPTAVTIALHGGLNQCCDSTGYACAIASDFNKRLPRIQRLLQQRNNNAHGRSNSVGERHDAPRPTRLARP